MVHLYFLGWMFSFIIHGQTFSDTEQYRAWAVAGFDPGESPEAISPWVYPVLAQIPIFLSDIAGPDQFLLVWTLIISALNAGALLFLTGAGRRR